MSFANNSKRDLYGLVDRTLIPHTWFNQALSSIDQCFRVMQTCADPVCLAIVGDSRTGKSRVLEQFGYQHRPKRTKAGRVVAFLRVKVPSKPTVKGLVTLLLYALGDPASDSGTEIAKTLRLLTLLKQAKTVILALDEFQHFYDKTTHSVQHLVADWLKVLVDEAHIGLIVTGLPTCMAVIEQNEQLAGRFMAPIHLPRFDWNIAEHRAEFGGILAAMGESLSVFEWPKLDAPEIIFRFYCATGGLIGYLTKLLKQATWDALDAGRNTIGLPDLSIAHNKALVKGNILLQNGFAPFDKDFHFGLEILPLVRTIGTACEEPAKPRNGSRQPRKAKAADVLAGKN
ncbi:TniB family NTP-binding protein [Dechloromonas denitrificans]|uniref:TniB family NTP-binding protein n=1 Tax=Dechloromonas denitrificans TaxID=281362 RepID=UPI001CFBEE46|nr:TniB family NTP-binding protein [Dechloromonas denitrificans]UCV07005.1 TniB family NTP-binding protein [Dechloromonas denitrificans]